MEIVQLIFTIIFLLAAAANIFAASVVLAGAKDRKLGGAFVGIALCMAAWNTLWGLESIPGFVTSHPLFIRLMGLSGLVMPAIVFHGAVIWSGSKATLARALLILGYIGAAGICALHLQGLILDGFILHPSGSAAHAGRYYSVFCAFTVVWVCLGLALCWHVARQSTSQDILLRVRYWNLATCVALPLTTTNFLVNYGLPLPPLGGLGSIFIVAVLAYAAVRHRLMDIDVFVLRLGASFLSAVLVIILPLAGAVLWSQGVPNGAGGLLVVTCLLVAALTTLLLFFWRLRVYLEQELDKSLRPARYAARNAIRQLSAELVQLPNPSNLAEMLTAHLRDGLEVSGVALYLRPTQSRNFDLASKAGTIETPPHVACPPTTTTKAASPEAAALGWDTCIPVRSRDTDLGFLALTPKRSAAAIEDAEVTLLGIVAAQLAIALQNVEYVREIERQTAEIEALRKQLEAENVSLRAEVRAVSQFKEIIGSSAALQDALARVASVAPTPLTVLITGETGTGKELIARAIHERSPRCTGPLISVNCAAIPTALAESELFGHERGAFTDAIESRPGKFELAAGGTLFLDEVAELPVSSQVKLLRVLEQREAQRIGGRKPYKVDCRVIAATNRDLKAEMRAGTFREDLYFRLNGMPVHVPPLRERVDDIPMLATFFLQRAATTYQKNVTGFTAEALAALGRYNWPGNIRELQHVVERAVLLCSSDVLRPAHLSDLAPAADAPPAPDSLSASLREEKIRRVQLALAQCGGNQAAAARLLGMSRSNFGRLLKSLGLKPHGSAMQ